MNRIKKAASMVLAMIGVLALAFAFSPAKQTSAMTTTEMNAAYKLGNIGSDKKGETLGAANLNEVKSTYYKFTIDRELEVTFKVTFPGDFSKKIYVCLWNGDNTRLRGNVTSEANFKYDGDKNISYDKWTSTLSAGTYFIQVEEHYTNPGTKFEVTTSAKIDQKMSLTAAKLTKNKTVKLTWTECSGVDGYTIYRADEKNGKYTVVGRVTDPDDTSFEDTKVRTGRKYYYKVRAYDKTNNGTQYTPYTKIKKVSVK